MSKLTIIWSPRRIKSRLMCPGRPEAMSEFTSIWSRDALNLVRGDQRPCPNFQLYYNVLENR